MSRPLYLVITIDVEEEGLFTGTYPQSGAGVANVAELRRLEFIPRNFGFPLTLLATYPVARDAAAQEVLRSWKQEHGAEIGVHLHPWNTPPFGELPDPEPVPTARLPLTLVEAKLQTLINCLTDSFQEPPRCFRMGRFDWSSGLLGLLPGLGLRVDSSMVPLTWKGEGPINFLAPPDPFWLEAPTPPAAGLLEVPVTMVPVFQSSARAVHRLAGLLPAKIGQALLAHYRFAGAAGIHPAWFPRFSMRLAAGLHRRRGGRVLTLFLHSSELLPGGCPDFPNAAAVDRLVAKLRSFLAWLVQQGPVTGLTLSGLYDLMAPASSAATR
uniref:Deacetylase n=1 Tax=Desulfobacca acetoxidans TaxID=60893 RepID=A0A7C3Z013_9BACT